MRLLIILLLLIPNLAYADKSISPPIKVVSSISPIASLIAMIAEDKVVISIIANSQVCPHHYSLKPSDLKNAEDADLFVYIDDNFDTFATLLLPKSRAKIMRISNIDGLKLAQNNWHLWLLPENAMLILRSAEVFLSEISPENADFFKSNLKKNIVKMQGLEEERQRILHTEGKFTLLTDSAEYLFMDTSAALTKLYQRTDYASIKMIERLKAAGKTNPSCYVISKDQDLDKYRNLFGADAHIVQLSTENWSESNDLQNLYYMEYAKMLRLLLPSSS